MTKVIYNGKEIELIDELEDGYMELDMLINDDKINKLEDTIELKTINLEDTQEFQFGDIYE